MGTLDLSWDPADLVRTPTMTTAFHNQVPPELSKARGQTLLKGEGGDKAPGVSILLGVWLQGPGPAQPRAALFPLVALG